MPYLLNFSSNDEIHTLSQAGYQGTAFSFPVKFVENYIKNTRDDIIFELLNASQRILLPQPKLMLKLKRLVNTILSALKHHKSTVELLQKINIDETLLNLYFEVLLQNNTSPINYPTSRFKLLQKIIDYIDAEKMRPPKTENICQSVNISKRTLQYFLPKSTTRM